MSAEVFDIDRLAVVPTALRERPQWVVWRFVTRDGKPAKVPFAASGASAASSTDPGTWSTFEQACDRCVAGGFEGVGFVFAPDDPFCGIDLDGSLEGGEPVPAARQIIEEFATYTEISPSGNGVKLFLAGRKPARAGCVRRDVDGIRRVEVYDSARFFTVTGRTLPGTPGIVADRQEPLTALCERLWPAQGVPLAPFLGDAPTSSVDMATRENRCLAYIDKCPDAVSGHGGHDATLRAACECFRFGLDEAAAWRVMRRFNDGKTGGERWTDKELAHKLESARRKVEAAGETGVRMSETPAPTFALPASGEPNPCSIIDLIRDHPHMRPPLIHGLLRRGETANLIAAAKLGKSWMSLDLAVSVADGGMFLDTFQCEPGPVLLIDNELHPETLADRMPKVIAARGLDLASVGPNIFVESLRGRLSDLPGMESYFRGLRPGRFALIICDAFYRFLPGGMDENDNGAMAGLYNLIDRYAAVTGASFVLIHHTSKGDQSQKAVTDVGSGAGAQSRAPDAHIALRRHEEDGCAVLQAEVRSWRPPGPLCLRWEYPLWRPAPELDPAALRSPGSRRNVGRPPKEPAAGSWTTVRFVEHFVTHTPRSAASILAAAEGMGMTCRRAKSLLTMAEEEGLAHRWRQGKPNRADYATIPQPSKPSLTHTNTPHTPQGNAV